MSGGETGLPFVYTPTWVIAVVCFIIVLISLCAERGLHKLGKCFKHKNQEALLGALQKVKEELMLLGFISLLLSVFQGLIGNICMPEHLINTMLPCKLETSEHLTATNGRRLLAKEETSGKCSEGKVPFLSLEALHQIHIFIFVLAVVYVIFCAATMVLGSIKMKKWRHWENSMKNESSNIRDRSSYEKFLAREGKYGRKFRVVSWMAAFFKQFYGSVTKSDYIALRSGFIREQCSRYQDYDFHQYIIRTLEHDFKKIIGIRWYLWLFVVIFLLMNLAGWHTYFWLSFLPLILLLIVGAKLEHIITELAKEASERAEDAEGTPVRLSDELFWFHRPALVLYLIHFILFQNSFEVAFFFWIWCTYGFRSCIMEDLYFIIPRLVVGVIVQVLCSYSTLPLYALVTQMGSMFKQTVFDETIHGLIMSWAKDKIGSTGANGSTSKLTNESTNPISFARQPNGEGEIKATEIELFTSNL